MTKSLDEIMEARTPAPDSEHNPAPEPVTPAQPTDAAAQAAVEGAPAAEQPGQQPQPEGKESGAVPLKALQESRGKEKEAREENQRLQRLIDEQARQMAQLQSTVIQMQNPAKPKETAPVPEIWADPNGFVNHAIDPVKKEVQDRFLATSELLAIEKHGEEAVTAAGQEMLSLAQSGDQGAALEYQRIMASKHPYGELVNWHQRRQMLAEIGSDPKAYREKLRAEFLAEMQQQQPAPLTPTPAVTPQIPGSFAEARNQGSRAAPIYSGPLPLSEIMNR